MASPAELAAMRRALELAVTPGVPRGPNPRVGCVLLDADGRPIGEGFHRGAGTDHAEVDALREAGATARGATAVVTLEPCAHTGRTGPCAEALVAAGVARVVFAQADPNPVAAGGATRLADAGVDVEGGVLAAEAEAINPAWTFAVLRGRPFVTWKVAQSLDGRSAAADGTSRWITGPAARAAVHDLRRTADAVLVGTGTVRADDPRLTVRGADDRDDPDARQPVRAVMGLSDVPAGAAVRDGCAPFVHLRTRDPQDALARLHDRECRHVLLEGGPTLAGAFVAAGLVDEVVAFVAPLLLGAGLPSLRDAGVSTLAEGVRLRVVDVGLVGTDVRWTGRPVRPGEEA